MSGQASYKLLRYVLAGGFSFLFEYSVFVSAVYVCGASAEAGQAVSYILTLIVNFLILRSWTFKSKDRGNVHKHLVKYGILVTFNLPATMLLIGWLSTMGLAALIAKIVVVAATTIWNYFVYDKLIFRQPLSPEDVI